MKPATMLNWIVGVGIVAITTAVLLPAFKSIESSPKAQAQSDAVGLKNATCAYFNEYGNHPSGQNAEIITALTNGNPRRIVFLEMASDSSNKRGEFCDPWKTPYRITTSGTNVEVRSAGPDRKFGTADDITAP